MISLRCCCCVPINAVSLSLSLSQLQPFFLHIRTHAHISWVSYHSRLLLSVDRSISLSLSLTDDLARIIRMSAPNAAREAEADALMKQAHKHLEKTLTRWKPNYDSAADEYEKAAKLYTNLRLRDKAIDAWRRASQAHAKAQNPLFAGRCLENLASFLVDYATEATSMNPSSPSSSAPPTDPASALAADANAFTQAAAVYEEAGVIYSGEGKIDRYADLLVKAAETVGLVSKRAVDRAGRAATAKVEAMNQPAVRAAFEANRRYVSSAIDVYEQAWEVDKTTPYKLPDLYRNLTLQCIRTGNVVGAVQIEERMIGIGGGGGAGEAVYNESKNLFKQLNQPHNAAKAGLEIVVLCLSANGDVVWASQEMEKLRSVFGFGGSPEQQAAYALLAAYEERDPEQLEEAVKSHHEFNFLTADVSRMAKKLSIGSGGAGGSASPQMTTAAQQQQQQKPVTVSGAAVKPHDPAPPAGSTNLAALLRPGGGGGGQTGYTVVPTAAAGGNSGAVTGTVVASPSSSSPASKDVRGEEEKVVGGGDDPNKAAAKETKEEEEEEYIDPEEDLR